MKVQFLRRVGALILALALTMTLTVPARAEAGSVKNVTLNKTTLSLDVGESEKLIATVAYEEPEEEDEDGADEAEEDEEDEDAGVTVKWSTNDRSVASVDEDGTVTGKGKGTAVITATVEDGGKTYTATCTVTVNLVATGIDFIPVADEVWGNNSTWEVTVRILPDGFTLGDTDEIVWDISPTGDTTAEYMPEIKATGSRLKASVTKSVKGHPVSPGEYYITASYGGFTKRKKVTISGITLSRTSIPDMHVGENRVIAVDKVYGFADNGVSTADVEWSSSDPATVSVMHGELIAWKLSAAPVIITATKNGYTATCEVRVVEDKSVVAGPYNKYGGKTISTGNPLRLDDVQILDKLKSIAREKSKEEDAYGNVTYSELEYITNVAVPTSQGTLYYNYKSEASTGAGVGLDDAFMENPGGASTKLDIKKLYFVPRQGFKGTAEITFIGWAVNGTSFNGIIKVEVGAGSGAGGSADSEADPISYRTQAGEPAWFMDFDFNAFCRSVTGRNFSSITFSLPKASEGTLYYNYMAGSGIPVTSTTKFTPAGVYTLDNVCFVPNAAYDSDDPVIISFHAVDSAGDTASGKVEIVVDQIDVAGDLSNVVVFCEKGRSVTLSSELFNDACRDTIDDTLAFVMFKLPDPKEGALYYNYQSNGSYESNVSASTRYYYSGAPGLSGVTFVPSSGASGRIAIPYTGYGSTGTSFSGTLYISLEDGLHTTIYYSVEKGGSVTFSAADFYNAGLYKTGIGVTYVRFDVYSTDLGSLYHNYRGSNYYNWVVAPGTNYYTSTSYSNRLGLISFHAGDKTGTFTISYTAYCGTGSSQQKFTGKVVIKVGTLAPEDVVLSCKAGGYTSGEMLALLVNSACDAVMNGNLAYIEITSVPDAKEGHLYRGYVASRSGSGTVVKQGSRFYRAASPSISQLVFVPFARFTGEAEITYIGYSSDGQEQVSGRILVSVSKSTTSVFDDMGGYEWAMDSVNYLYWNRTVQGDGTGSFLPLQIVRKCDFALMLVRAYGLTAGGNVSFKDVPDDAYYADAMRIAAVLGIISGRNGYYSPTSPLTRQEAIVMIYNTLQVVGKATTNGLAADLSVYRDERAIDVGAREAMGILVQMGVVEGDGGYLQPQRQFTRAEAAMLLHTIMTL